MANRNRLAKWRRKQMYRRGYESGQISANEADLKEYYDAGKEAAERGDPWEEAFETRWEMEGFADLIDEDGGYDLADMDEADIDESDEDED